MHLGVLALVVLALPLAADAQPIAKLPRIGVLWQTAPPPPVHPQTTALLQGLKELGWEDGKSVVIEYRYGANQADRLATFAAELVRLKVDVITTAGDFSTHAARQATTTIPIVALVGFPVESGFVKSLSRPGGNITGVAVLADMLAMKRLEMLKDLLPRLSRVAVLWDPVTHERQPRAAEAAARRGAPGPGVADVPRQPAHLREPRGAAPDPGDVLQPTLGRERRPGQLRADRRGAVETHRGPNRQDPQGRAAVQSAHPAADAI